MTLKRMVLTSLLIFGLGSMKGFGETKLKLPVAPLPKSPVLGDLVCSAGKVMFWNGLTWAELGKCDAQGNIVVGRLPEPKPARADVFAPVPKDGCPSGYYEVEHTFHDGLNWHSACWSKKLNRMLPEERVEVKISYEQEGTKETDTTNRGKGTTNTPAYEGENKGGA